MNNITIELCAEDRARLDRLAAALDKLAPKCEDCARGVADAVAAYVTTAQKQATAEAEAKPEPVTPTTEEKPTEAPKEAAVAKETAAPTVTPTEKEEQPAEPEKPTVTLAQIQQKVIRIASDKGGAKKAKVREIINAYGSKVSDLKEQPDKWGEVWERLTALESED